jgi:hypothetical protein
MTPAQGVNVIAGLTGFALHPAAGAAAVVSADTAGVEPIMNQSCKQEVNSQ